MRMSSRIRDRYVNNWRARHIVVVFLGAFGAWLFLESRAEWSAMHRWNRAVGDVSLIFVAAAMALGPLSRLSRRFVTILPYRRELGIYAIVLAAVHTTIILFGWVNLDLMRLFGFEFHPELQRYVMVQHGFALANAVGIFALLYGVVLAATSNDASMRWMGSGVWKYVQQGTYVLWWLSVAHTAYFLFVHFIDFHRRTPDPNWAQLPFVALVLTVLGLQFAASIKTWRRSRSRSESSPA